MDYDRYDALLHYIFKQTQGDAWFRPDAAPVPAPAPTPPYPHPYSYTPGLPTTPGFPGFPGTASFYGPTAAAASHAAAPVAPAAGGSIAGGVCMRDDAGAYRVFPYEDRRLEPFERAVSAMGLLVAVKVRSAAAHAAVGEV